jgi:hypothetical protein
MTAIRNQTIQYSNVSGTPEDARVFLLGDIHTDRTHGEQRRSIFQQYAKAGDIVLFESRQQFYELNPDFFKETRGLNVICMGWDSEFHVKALKELTKEQIAIAKAMEEPTDPLTRELAHHRFAKLQQDFKKLNLERDKFLLETVRKLREMHPDKTIFVRGGDEHIMSKAVQWGLRNEKIFCATFAESNDQESLESYNERLFRESKRAPLEKVSAPVTLRAAPHPAYKANELQQTQIIKKSPLSLVKKVVQYAVPIIALALAYRYMPY